MTSTAAARHLTRPARALAGLVAGLVACCLVVLGASPAAAHTELVDITPGDGERLVTTAPPKVSLTFNEALDPDIVTLVVVDASGAVVPASATRVSGPTVSQVLLEVPDAGRYTIRYRVVGGDGHPVDGESTFTVAPAAQPSPTPSPQPSADPTPAETTPAETTPADPAATESETADSVATTTPTASGSDDSDGSGGAFLAVGAAVVVLLLVGGAAVAHRSRTRRTA